MADDPAETPTVRTGPERGELRDPAAPPRYQPVREIARGGMGRVVEAVDTQLARTVALKQIIDEHPDARARFEREVAITARLEHPSIVPLYDSGTGPDGSPFYVMRRVTGEPLDAKIRGATTLDQRLRLLPNVLAMADAVAHAHARGVIHRDLKPANVLVGALGETVVIDWGLAKLIGEADPAVPRAPATSDALRTVAGTVFGTPGFMAPEQVAGDDVDERADVYALGACLYHVLGGRPPFHGSSESEIFERTRSAAPEALAALAAGVPPDLVTIVEKAMARAKSDRYLDAGGFSEDLRRFLGGQLVAAHHYPLHQRFRRWLRRHRALVVVIALAAVASILVGAWSLRRVFAEQDRAEAALVREHARAEDLLVFKASAYLDIDPTLAAASLQQLPVDSPRWSDIGALVSGIRARGVAYGYPNAGPRLNHVDPAPTPGDPRVLVSGIGMVRLIDLAARTSFVLSEGPATWRAVWCGANVVIYYRGNRSELVDPVTRAVTAPPWPGNAADVECTANGTALFVDAGKLFVAAPGARATEVAGLTAVKSIDASASRRWLVAAAADRTTVLRARGATYEEAYAVPAKPGSVAFSADERRVAISFATETVELDLETATVRRRWSEPACCTLHYIGDRLHRWRAGRHIELLDDTGVHYLAASSGLQPEVDLDGRQAMIVDPHTIAIAGTTLRAPEPVEAIATTRDHRYLLATGPSRVFAWRVAEIVSRRSTVASGENLGFASPHALVASTDDDRFATFRYAVGPDLAITEVARGRLTPMTRLATYAGVILAYDPTLGTATILEPERHVIAGAGAITAVHALDETALVVGNRAGEIHRIEVATGRAVEKLGDPGFPIVGLGAQRGWVAAIAGDGRIWRRDPSGAVTQARVPAWISSHVEGDGRLLLARGSDLLQWSAGEPAILATFPRALAGPALLHVTPAAVVVAVEGGGLFRFDRGTGAIIPVLETSRQRVVAPTGLAVAAIGDGLTIADTATNHSYRLVDHLGIQPNGLAISPDGSTVVATEIGTRTLHAWRIAVPSPYAWVMQATNAVAPATAGAPIVWR